MGTPPIRSVFPSAEPDWNNPNVIHLNTLPPRSHFFPFQSEDTALTYDHLKSSFVRPLSGTWQFHHSPNPFEAPEISEGAKKLDTTNLNGDEWSEITVPGMWQLQGYGVPHYTNIVYLFPVNPPNVPAGMNETGTYQREFDIPREQNVDVQYRVRFEGVDSAFHIWVNGKAVGYSQGSRNPAEFDVSDYVEDGSNWITVRVYRFCNASQVTPISQGPIS